MTNRPKFLTDHKGNKIGVVLDIKLYKRMLEKLEELHAMRAYDAAKASDESPVPYEEFRERIIRSRK